MANPSPGVIPTFDTTQTNVTVTTNGHKTSGYANSEVPTAGEFNYWFNLVYLWIVWISNQIHNTWLNLIIATNVTATVSGYPSGGTGLCYKATTAGSQSATLSLDIPVGYRLSSFTWNNAANGAAQGPLVCTIGKALNNGTLIQSLAALTVATVPTSATDETINLALASSGLTVTVATGSGNVTYTRSTGSFLTDGFIIGQTVAWTGFVNSGNNQTITITGLSATVMTALQGTGTAETGAAAGETVTGVPPISDGAGQFVVTYTTTTTSTNSIVYTGFRYTLAPF